MINRIRPVVIAVHPNLINELKIRQEEFKIQTGRNSGGLTIFSELAAQELKYLRMSNQELYNTFNNIKVKINPIKIDVCGEERMFIPYEDFKKIIGVTHSLFRKKDQKQIKLEIQKVKGLKKNEIKFLWN
jgi:hypothetical protein